MTMPWFKMFDDAQNDAKLETLTDAQHRVWFKMMCYANKQAERGTVPSMKPRLLAIEVSRGDVALLSETLEALIDLEMLSVTEDGGHTWVNWAKRQERRPSDRPEATKVRKQKERARDKQKTEIVTPLDKEVTGVSRGVTKSHETEEEEDVDVEEERESRSYNHVDPAPAEKNEPKDKSQTVVRAGIPGQAPLPPQVKADLELRDFLMQEAATLMNSGRLTKAHENKLHGWFAEHKRALSREIISEGIDAAATYTEGDSLSYLLTVMQRRMEDPGHTKPKRAQGGSTNGKHPPRTDATLDSVTGEWIPAERHSWATNPDGLYVLNKRGQDGRYPSRCMDAKEHEAWEKQKWAEHDRRRLKKGTGTT